MSKPVATPKNAPDLERRLLDDALDEGLRETFPASGSRDCHPAAAEQGRLSRQAEWLSRVRKSWPEAIIVTLQYVSGVVLPSGEETIFIYF